MPKQLLKIRVWTAAWLFGISTATAIIPTNVTFVNYFPGVTFARPLFFAEVPGKDSNYVVLEQQLGLVGIVHRRAGVWVKDTLVKITTVSNDNILGLLGIAFHPDYANNHKYYLFYSQNSTANIVEERQADASLIKDAGVAGRQLLRITRSTPGNNGGDMAFGPNDGYLYIGIGDGGDPQGDTPNRAQNPDTLLGKFIRIDVNATSPGRQYAIPADNPFVGNSAYRPEIWALGLRMPWRWSFDPLTGNLWVGEVGNATFEEVDTVAKGANLGWRLMEGYGCQPTVTCNPTGLTRPNFTYGHTGGDNAIIGGHVFRGNPASTMYGVYFFGDNGSGRIRAMRMANGVKSDSAVMTATVAGISAFGTDSKGSLYAMSVTTNIVYRLTSPDLVPVPLWKPSRKPIKTLAPIFGRNDFSGLDLRNLQGKRMTGKTMATGLYLTRGAGKSPALVPVLK